MSTWCPRSIRPAIWPKMKVSDTVGNQPTNMATRTGRPSRSRMASPVQRRRGENQVADPSDTEAIGWLCDLLAAGRADLYGQDEADLALLPTLTRTWMRRDHQLKVPAPGTNEKRSVSVSIDLAEGALLWRTDAKRC